MVAMAWPSWLAKGPQSHHSPLAGRVRSLVLRGSSTPGRRWGQSGMVKKGRTGLSWYQYVVEQMSLAMQPKRMWMECWKGRCVLFEEAVADEALGGAGLADVVVHVIGHGGVVVRFGRVEGAAIAGAEGVFAADAAQEGGVLAFAVDVDILGAAVAPAIGVVEEADTVDEAEELAGSVGVEHEEFFAVALGGHLTAPAGAEAARLLQGLAGIAVPVDLEVGAVVFGAGFELDAGGAGEGHGEVAVVADPGLGGEEVGVDGIPAEAVHDAEEVADGRFDVGDGFVVEVDADDGLAAGVGQVFGAGKDDPDMLDAAGSVELGVGGALVGWQGAGDGDAVGNGGWAGG